MQGKETRGILKIGLPKGSLEKSTFDLMARAGYEVTLGSRSHYPNIADPEVQGVMFRAQEMSRYVENGVVDVGLTGYDWILENGSDVVEVAELVYSKQRRRPARWVIAVAAESPIQKVEDLDGKMVATELVEVTRRFFEKNGINAKVEFSWGATEVKARLVDAIVEVTETGSSLKANNLRTIGEVLTSTTRLIANKDAWGDPWKRKKIERLALLLEGAIVAKDMVGLKLNVSEDSLKKVLSLLPAMKNPTVSPLAGNHWYAVDTIVAESEVRTLIPELKDAGAQGIIEYPLNKVIP
ncbi:MAG: ATP phosphoribosyltransferase [Planctomycetes bacterium]|nr:ATP phosphoribosyltransferase [Planctomycetota bacterium]